MPVSKSLLLCKVFLFVSELNSILKLKNLKYSYISLVTPLLVFVYFIAKVCKVNVVSPGDEVIIKPCCTELEVTPLICLVKTHVIWGGTKAALNLSVRENPLSAVAIGWKFTPSIVPIAFSKSVEFTKSYTLI